MPFQSIFGSCFPFAGEEVDQSHYPQTSSHEPEQTPRTHTRSRSVLSHFSLRVDTNVGSAEMRTLPPVPTINIEEAAPLPQRPNAVRSHSCPSSTRDTHRGNSPYGPTLTIHDADLANELLGSTSSLCDGQYSFLDGSFVPRPLSCISNHSRRASMPGDLRSITSPTSPIHTHNRGARSLGNLQTGNLSPYLMPLSPIHRPTSPTTIDTRRISTATVATSFESEESVETIETIPVPRCREDSVTSSSSVPAETIPQTSAECKEALGRIKVAMQEKESLERRLRELERLITGKTVRSQPQEPQTIHIVVEPVAQPAHVELTANESEAVSTVQQDARSISTRATSFEDDTSIVQESYRPTVVPLMAPAPAPQQRQRPRLPQLQTSIPLSTPIASEERQTPSTAVRLTSAVSRIANWIFGDEEHSAYPQTPTATQSPQLRRQHASVQPFQLIQAHHLTLTPTSPQYQRRTAHLSTPAATSPAPASAPIVGYQQRWRPRNVEDVDPVPPYYEQDPNPSPGFVFFPQNSLLTPLATPTSPSGVSIASQMYAQAV
ncbi:hypothetical protein H072_2535 [Dactylellina haptotyla CBS 200.50]|uniref:Uncharacterized protein n=1 Tax=Dactylellina haptotyla (strain CBS 200.50) TaxID=1284197 RepID=S8BVI7_DACHA|nr:hypothetical protein H072_2535 [Dactylellina haptotyla CBS 200.50]